MRRIRHRMTWMPTCSRIAIFVAAGVPMMTTAWAQPGRGGPQPQTLSAEDGRGTVDAVGPGVLRLRLKGGEFWTVVPAPNARVSVVGSASREMLQEGQFVSCSLSLDEFGKVSAPPVKIVFPGGGTPGVIAGGLGIAEPNAKRVSGRRPAGTYLVSGTIRRFEDGTISVLAGKERFEIPVADDVELSVQTNNAGLISAGDAVEVEGRYLRRGELQATSLAVTLRQPVTPPSKQRGGRRPAKQAEPAAE